MFIDPEGHEGCIVDADGDEFCDASLPEDPVVKYCEGTLEECFLLNQLAELGYKEIITLDEFNDLLDAIYEDLNNRATPPVLLWLGLLGYVPGGLAGRDHYDTPIWNGRKQDIQVCIEGHGCDYTRSEINYVAQGMWGAASYVKWAPFGESKEKSLKVTEYWNQKEYGHGATEGERYWTEFGYDAFMIRYQAEQQPRLSMDPFLAPLPTPISPQ
jgi:hypothetical protein